MIKQPDAKRVAPQTLRMVCCAVQNEEYCLEMSAVRSIGRAHLMTLPADAEERSQPAGAIGWIAAHPNKVPVFDLAHRLQLAPSPEPTRTGFVMLIHAPQPFAVRVDHVTGNIEVAHSQITVLPPIVEAGADKIFKGIVKLADKWLLCAEASNLQFAAPAAVSPFEPGTLPPRRAAQPAAQTIHPNNKAQIMLFSAALNVGETTERLPLVFGLSITQVQEITDLSPIIAVPGAPSYVFGITNWRGIPVPIIDLQSRLGMSAAPVAHQRIAARSRLLIARAPDGWLGFPIKPQVKAFPLPIPYQQNQQNLSLDRDLVKGIFDLEGTPLLIPDLDAVLTQKFVPQPQAIG